MYTKENILEKNIAKIRETLREVISNFEEGAISIDFAVICNCAIELLDEIFGEDNYTLPIDIHYIYEKLGISLYEVDLNSYMEGCVPKRVNRIIGKISIRKNIMTDKIKRSVYIDENTAPILQRYAMAHELCHYIMQSEKSETFSDEYCNMPMLPKDSTELVADAFAIFLLIPLGPFLQEFLKYVINEKESGRPPFRTSDWIEHLSSICFISKDFVACGYEQIRTVAAWLYNMKDKECNDCENVRALLNKRDRYLTEDVIRHLYL